jgi:hypothetical protein
VLAAGLADASDAWDRDRRKLPNLELAFADRSLGEMHAHSEARRDWHLYE